MVRLAAAAYRDRAGGIELFAETERSYVVILRNISQLTDEEADLIEPEFTKFELEFNDLARAIYPG